MDRPEVLERVRQHLSSVGLTAAAIEETTALGDIGLTSFDVMVLLLGVHSEYHLEESWIADIPFPKTIGELAGLVERLAQG